MHDKNAIDRIERFLDKLSTDEYKLSPKAYEILFSDSRGNKKSLAHYLYMSINNYEKSKSVSMINIASENSISVLLEWMSNALAYGVILDNTMLMRKLKEKEEENRLLKNENSGLRKRNDVLQETVEKYGTDLVYWRGKHDELEEKLGKAFIKGEIYRE